MLNGSKRVPSVLQIAIVALLLALTPYAMSFSAYDRIYSDGAWNAQIDTDPLYKLRAILIIIGLTGAALGLACLLWEILLRRNEMNDITTATEMTLRASVTICSMSVGWAGFPYWVNGISAHQDVPLSAFDPKALMPMIWIGETWRLGVLAVALVALLSVPVLGLLTIAFSLKSRRWNKGLATAVFLGAAAAVFLLSPNYLTWLLD